MSLSATQAKSPQEAPLPQLWETLPLETRRRLSQIVASSVLRVHEYWLTDLARWLTMPFATLYKWQRLGWVHSRKVEVSGGRWAIWADDDALERLGQLRAHNRKWPEPGRSIYSSL